MKRLFSSLSITKVTLVAILLTLTNSLYAQDDVKKFRFGLEGGLGMSWLKPADNEQMESGSFGFSYNYGLQLEYKFSDNAGFQTGFQMNSIGGGINYSYDAKVTADTVLYSPSSQSYRLDYVTLPLYLKMNTNEIGYLTYFGLFGLNMDVNYNALADIEYTGENEVKPIEDQDVSDSFFLLNSSLVFGIGAEYNLSGHTYMTVSLTYQNGWMNVFSSTVQGINDIDVPNNTIALDEDTQLPIVGSLKKATAKNISLNVGIFF